MINGRRLRIGAEDIAQRRWDAMRNADMALVRQVAAVLEREWPGHFFRVTADHAQRMLKIELPPMLQTPYSYNIPIPSLHTDPGLRQVIRAGGEILERFRLPTHRWSADDYKLARQSQSFHANRQKGYRVPE